MNVINKSGGCHKLNKIKRLFIFYCRQPEGSARKTKYCLSLNNQCLLYNLVDNMHELRVFYTNTKRCTQCIQELALLYKKLQ